MAEHPPDRLPWHPVLRRSGVRVPRFLSYQQAAARTNSHVETIKRWRRMGLSFALVDGRRVVRDDALLAFWRERMKADPVHRAVIARDRLQDASGAVVASGRPEPRNGVRRAHRVAQQHPDRGRPLTVIRWRTSPRCVALGSSQHYRTHSARSRRHVTV